MLPAKYYFYLIALSSQISNIILLLILIKETLFLINTEEKSVLIGAKLEDLLLVCKKWIILSIFLVIEYVFNINIIMINVLFILIKINLFHLLTDQTNYLVQIYDYLIKIKFTVENNSAVGENLINNIINKFNDLIKFDKNK